MLEVATKANKSQPATSKSSDQRQLPTELDKESKVDFDSIPRAPVTVGFQTRVPVITGEVHFKGTMAVDGVLAGTLDNNAGSLEVRQKSMASVEARPELSGQFYFQQLVRINGHVAGTVHSEKGTLIVASGATVDANVDVTIAIIRGTVNGDIVAQQRVELGMGAKVFGNIWTRSIAIEDGATFDGVCSMLANR